MDSDHDLKTRKLSVQLRGIRHRQNVNVLMYMSKTNVIHYSKRIIMDCLFRVCTTKIGSL